jgi:hypothetical protein
MVTTMAKAAFARLGVRGYGGILRFQDVNCLIP